MNNQIKLFRSSIMFKLQKNLTTIVTFIFLAGICLSSQTEANILPIRSITGVINKSTSIQGRPIVLTFVLRKDAEPRFLIEERAK